MRGARRGGALGGARRWLVLVAVVALVATLGGTARSAAAEVDQSVDLVTDGGFERGASSQWQVYGAAPAQVFTTAAPHGGAFSASLCGTDRCAQSIEQKLPLSYGEFSTSYLRFSVRVDGADRRPGCKDALVFGIAAASQSEYFTGRGAYAICPDKVPNGSYVDVEIDLNPEVLNCAGDCQLVFRGYTDAATPARFFVDDVSFRRTPSGPPNFVTVPQATPIGPGKAAVTWEKVDRGSPLPTSYTITPSTGRGPVTVPGDRRSVIIDGLPTDRPITFGITATNGRGSGQANPTKPFTFAKAAPVRSMVSDEQYVLQGSDGVTWQPIDPQDLGGSFTAPASGRLHLTANAALFTGTPDLNQDLGIRVTSDDGAYAGSTVAWKESGGRGSIYSPNAAAIEHVLDVKAGVTYRLVLVWKANKAVPGSTIYAGAGPEGLGYSDTDLTYRFFSSSDPTATITSSQSTVQRSLGASDGTTWKPLDPPVSVSLTPATDRTATWLANTDLWTAAAGINQDLGIEVTSSASATPVLVTWKESGGLAGTFSPNAAYAQGRMAVTAGVTYTARLAWKANKAAGAGVMLGAGPIDGKHSPTTLIAFTEPTAFTATSESRDRTGVGFYSSPYTDAGGTSIVRGSADLFTDTAGVNQRMRLTTLTGGNSISYAAERIYGWTESGGAAAFSPNAAALVKAVRLGHENQTQGRMGLEFGATRSPGQIYIGAGPLADGSYSPTSLYTSFVPDQ